MPFAPKSPCRTPRCPNKASYRGRCDDCNREDERQRGSAAARGYDDDWRGRRLEYLDTHPTCDEPGCGQPTAEPDHVVPIREARARGWTTEQIHADENLRPKCKRHHSKRTARDQAWWTHPSGPTGQRFVVFGPPDLGKTTWVEERRQPGDLVFDLDALAIIVAQSPTYPRPPHVAGALLAMRDALVSWLARNRSVRAFVIVANPNEAQRIANVIGAQAVLPTAVVARRQRAPRGAPP